METTPHPVPARGPTKVLYVAMRYDYGRPEQGTSFEFNNFYRTLQRMVPQLVEFDFLSVLQRQGQAAMNRLLLDTALRERPDLIFCCLFQDEIARATLEALSASHVTFNWFCDDHWRFDAFSRRYAPAFHAVSTTDERALDKYARLGHRRVRLLQWACNHYDYVRLADAVPSFEVSFVGQPHGSRRRVVDALRRSGLPLETFGKGWENGRVTQNQMIRIFNASRINLNLANSSLNIHTWLRRREQIKGRNFEIPGCGGFVLTNEVEGLARYYRPGEEVVCFRDEKDLGRLIRHYLSHEAERQAIAERGYRRTLSEHTYERRFSELFRWLGYSA